MSPSSLAISVKQWWQFNGGLILWLGGVTICWALAGFLARHVILDLQTTLASAQRACDAVNWHETEAIITRWVEEKWSRTTRSSRIATGTDHHVTYRYEYEDHRYHSEQLWIQPLSRRHRWDTWNRLRKAYDSARPVRCYVDPANPTDAVIERELRLGAYYDKLYTNVFVLLLCVIIAVPAALLLLEEYDDWRRRRAWPTEPWRWHRLWREGRVALPPLFNRAVVIFLFVGTCLLVPAIDYLLFAVPAVRQEGADWFILMGMPGVFLGLGVLSTATALAVCALLWRFHRSYVELDEWPVLLGGELRGRLVLRGRVSVVQTVDLDLRCEQEKKGNSGTGTVTACKELWRASVSHEIEQPPPDPTALALPLRFAIPGDCPECDNTHSEVKCHWRLHVTVRRGRSKTKRCFELPVFSAKRCDNRQPRDN